MNETNGYQHLGPRPGSRYRQWFVKGTRIRAETLYRQVVGPEGRTPEEVAEAFRVPVKAVHESIHYCEQHEDLLRQEREEESVSIKAHGWDQPPFVPSGSERKA